MNREALNDLLISFEEANDEIISDLSYNIYALFYNEYNEKPYYEIPDVAFIFMEIDNWDGMSLRCGVWQYYENISFENGKAEHLIYLLKLENKNKLADIYNYGIHDYSMYENCEDYPQEWIDESVEIDDWIFKNQDYLYKLKKELIYKYHNEILNLLSIENKG